MADPHQKWTTSPKPRPSLHRYSNCTFPAYDLTFFLRPHASCTERCLRARACLRIYVNDFLPFQFAPSPFDFSYLVPRYTHLACTYRLYPPPCVLAPSLSPSILSATIQSAQARIQACGFPSNPSPLERHLFSHLAVASSITVGDPRVCVHASPNPSILNQALRAVAGRLPPPFHHSQVPVFHAGESHPCASVLLRLPPLNFSHQKYDVGWLCMLMVADQPY